MNCLYHDFKGKLYWGSCIIAHNETNLYYFLVERRGEIAMSERLEVTYRPYELYFEMFELKPETLVGKQICDWGGGLADFTDYVNDNISGAHCVSLDPIYERVKKLGEAASYATVSENGKILMGVYPKVDDPILEQKMIDNRIKAIINSLKMDLEESPYIPGYAQEAPFETQTFDLIVASNFQSMGKDSLQEQQSFMEAIRVLKDHGEIRISPNDFVIKESGRIVLDVTQTDQNDILTFWQSLGDRGLSAYLVQDKHKKRSYMGLLILRKDKNSPEGLSNNLFVKRINLKDLALNSY